LRVATKLTGENASVSSIFPLMNQAEQTAERGVAI